jgi:hypothetical protein
MKSEYDGGKFSKRNKGIGGGGGLQKEWRREGTNTDNLGVREKGGPAVRKRRQEKTTRKEMRQKVA